MKDVLGRISSAWMIASLLIMGGCATELTKAGHDVLVVTVLTASDASQYEETGTVSCRELTYMQHEAMEESCRNGLRNEAAKMGAIAVKIESTGKIDCWPAKRSDCVTMNGRAYKRKPGNT